MLCASSLSPHHVRKWNAIGDVIGDARRRPWPKRPGGVGAGIGFFLPFRSVVSPFGRVHMAAGLKAKDQTTTPRRVATPVSQSRHHTPRNTHCNMTFESPRSVEAGVSIISKRTRSGGTAHPTRVYLRASSSTDCARRASHCAVDALAQQSQSLSGVCASFKT